MNKKSITKYSNFLCFSAIDFKDCLIAYNNISKLKYDKLQASALNIIKNRRNN
jgi:hypothetical protein